MQLKRSHSELDSEHHTQHDKESGQNNFDANTLPEFASTDALSLQTHPLTTTPIDNDQTLKPMISSHNEKDLETSTAAHKNILSLFKTPSDSQLQFIKMKRESILRKLGQQSIIKPLWAGRISLPGVSWTDTSAIFHSIIGPVALGPELGRLASFNLPPDLTIHGRISTEALFSYLRQVAKTPSRTIGIAQFVGKYMDQPDPLTKSPSFDVETPNDDSLYSIIAHLQKINRYGVIFSGLPPPSSFACGDNIIDKKTGLSSYHGWYIKDLYVLHTQINDDTPSLPEPLFNLDIGHILLEAINVDQDPSHLFNIDQKAFINENCLLFMVFVLARMPVNNHTTEIKETFRYKRLSQ